MENTEKKCNRCGIYWPLEGFYKNRKWYENVCRLCRVTNTQAWRDENRDHHLSYEEDYWFRLRRLLEELRQVTDFSYENFNKEDYKDQLVKYYLKTYDVEEAVGRVIEVLVHRNFDEFKIDRLEVIEYQEQMVHNWTQLKIKKEALAV